MRLCVCEREERLRVFASRVRPSVGVPETLDGKPSGVYLFNYFQFSSDLSVNLNPIPNLLVDLADTYQPINGRKHC